MDEEDFLAAFTNAAYEYVYTRPPRSVTVGDLRRHLVAVFGPIRSTTDVSFSSPFVDLFGENGIFMAKYPTNVLVSNRTITIR